MRSSFCLSQLLLFLLRALLSMAKAGDNVTVYGPVVAKPIFQDMRTAFMLVHPEVIDYSIAQADPNTYLARGSPVLVDVVEVNSLQFTSASLKFNLWGFPLVIVFNLGGPSRLLLTQQVLLDIALGRITRWDDNNLTRINPSITLPDQPITLVVGSLLDRFFEGLSVLANQTLNVSSVLNLNHTINEGPKVCSKVIATPYSLGFSWMGDAVSSGAKLAQLQNRAGFFVSPGPGASFALAEYRMATKYGLAGEVVTMHNLPGHMTWPIMDMYYLVLPLKFAACSQVRIIQQFLTFAMQFALRLSGMDQLVQLQGWQPAKSQVFLDAQLGAITPASALVDNIFSIACGNSEANPYHNIGASPPLWSTLLEMMGPYTGKIDNSLRLSGLSNITYLLDIMSSQEPLLDIDLVLTWEPILAPYPQLLHVPVFMAAIVPVVNFQTMPPVLNMPVLADIFAGVITRWNDVRIEALNPNIVLPAQAIIVFAAPITVPDDQTALFAQLLSQHASNFSWDLVNKTFLTVTGVADAIRNTPYSIGYQFGHFVEDGVSQVPRLLGPTGNIIPFTEDSIAACWTSFTDPHCWPMPTLMSVALRNPDQGTVTCQHQQVSVNFVNWAMTRNLQLTQYVLQNPTRSMGKAEYCEGRSLVVTRPELQALALSAKYAVYALCALGLFWTVCQAIALAVSRKQSELKSASVLFSLLAVVGVFFILLAPFLIVQDDPSMAACGSSVWLLVLGFSLCYGSLFAKLFRLYTIFTSRKLIVPRLSNRRLSIIVAAFLVVDLVLLLIYNVNTPPRPYVFSAFVPSSADLVTGYREFTLKMCSFQGDSAVLYIILLLKLLVAICGAGMAFIIRQVDRRFTATSALGWAFYNMFLTVVIAAIVVGFFLDGKNLEFSIFVPVFCGLWIMFVTLVALTLDSNVLLACKDFSKPLRRFLSNNTNSKNSKESTEGEAGKASNDRAPNSEPKRSHSSTTFVVNREMFPSKYEEFDALLLEKVRDELKFQLLAVRRALASTSAPSTTSSSLDQAERHRGSTAAGPHRFTATTNSMLGIVPTGSPRTGNRGLSEVIKSNSIECLELTPRNNSKPSELDILESSSISVAPEAEQSAAPHT